MFPSSLINGPCCFFYFSAGVGRTGVFIALSIVLERLQNEEAIDLFQTVRTLRTQRPGMVQTEGEWEWLDSIELKLNQQKIYSNQINTISATVQCLSISKWLADVYCSCTFFHQCVFLLCSNHRSSLVFVCTTIQVTNLKPNQTPRYDFINSHIIQAFISSHFFKNWF